MVVPPPKAPFQWLKTDLTLRARTSLVATNRPGSDVHRRERGKRMTGLQHALDVKCGGRSLEGEHAFA